MIPYPHFPHRTIIDLNSTWSFSFLGPNIDPTHVEPMSIECNDIMIVPSAFDATPRYAGKRGTALYRKYVTIPHPNRPSRLRIGASGIFTLVYVDGDLLHIHRDAYTEYWVDVPPSYRESRRLELVVNNTFDYNQCPTQLQHYDWYAYGGITRSVYWHILPPTVYIQNIHVIVDDIQYGRLHIRAYLGGDLDDGVSDEVGIHVAVRNSPTYVVSNIRRQSETLITCTLLIENPILWTIQHPHLYLIDVTIGSDLCTTRVGMRSIEVQGSQILFNGKSIKLLGFNRHESHPQFGPTLPPSLMISDIHHIKDMGCNFIRGSHYPQDQIFLDLCDELGILIWSEATAWRNTVEQCKDPWFQSCQLNIVHDMIQSSINHPSVIIWGFLNEGRSDCDESRSFYESMVTKIKSMDSTRLVTAADNCHEKSKMLDLLDVISFNLYPGWRGDDDDNDDTPLSLTEVSRLVDAKSSAGISRANNSGDNNNDNDNTSKKPFVISEIGAGAVWGDRDSHSSSQWTEIYQSKLLSSICEKVTTNDDTVAGVAMWCYCDFRTSNDCGSTKRSLVNNDDDGNDNDDGYNAKGVVDRYRRPKASCDAVRRILADGDWILLERDEEMR